MLNKDMFFIETVKLTKKNSINCYLLVKYVNL
jgi:hypothetical protein